LLVSFFALSVAMFVGVARFVLQIPGVRSLKERRRVVKSIKERVRAKLPVSIAEVGDVERYQVATLGLTVVSRDKTLCESVLSQARSMAASHGGALLADAAIEVMSFADGGSGIRGGIEHALDDFASPWTEHEEDDAER
jgi:uncharacterized protein YlxP (DUF503 family)